MAEGGIEPPAKNKYQLNSITYHKSTKWEMRNHRALPCTSCARHGFGGKCLLTKKNRSGGRTRTSLGTLPPLGIYRVSSQLLCKECCSLVGCIHCGVIGSPRSLSTCCIVGADHIRNANSHTRLECLLCATRCGRYACSQYVNVLLPLRGVVGRMGLEPIRIPYCLIRR